MRELAERCAATTLLILILTDFRVLFFDMGIVARVVTCLVATVLFGLLEYLVHKTLYDDVARSPYHKDHHNKPNSLADQIVAFESLCSWFAGLWALKMIGVLSGFFAGEMLSTYLLYEIFHTVTHAYPDLVPKATEWHSVKHHRATKKNYGVTTRGWDRVFGTQCEDKPQTDDHLQRVLDFIPTIGFVVEAVQDHMEGNTTATTKKNDPPVSQTAPLQTAIQPEN